MAAQPTGKEGGRRRSEVHLWFPHLCASIRLEVSLHFYREFVHEGYTESGACVGVGVPGLLVDLQCCLGSDVSKPAREVSTDVIDLRVV